MINIFLETNLIKLKDLINEKVYSEAEFTPGQADWEKQLYPDWEKRFITKVGSKSFTLGVKKLLTMFFYTNPKFGTGAQSADIVKNFKRTKNNKFMFNGFEYSKNEVLELLKKYQEQGFTDVDNDDKESIIYYFDKWPKKGTEIELKKNNNDGHFVNIWEREVKSKWPNGKLSDYNGLPVWEWEENGKTRAVAHSLDDTWFLMTKVNDEDKFKIDDVLFEL